MKMSESDGSWFSVMQADAELRWCREMGTVSVNCEAKGDANDREAPTMNIEHL